MDSSYRATDHWVLPGLSSPSCSGVRVGVFGVGVLGKVDRLDALDVLVEVFLHLGVEIFGCPICALSTRCLRSGRPGTGVSGPVREASELAPEAPRSSHEGHVAAGRGGSVREAGTSAAVVVAVVAG